MLKRIILFVLLIFCWVSAALAQSGGFHYQASLRNGNGNALSNQNLSVRLNLKGGNGLLYSETHQTTSNDFGIFSIEVGSQSQTEFMELPWGDGPMSMDVEIDDGSGFTAFGSTNLTSVPYALFALKSGDANSIEDIQVDEQGDVLITFTNGEIKELSGLKGPQGEPGPEGPEGPEGAMGSPGRDGTGVRILGTIAVEEDLDPSHSGDVGEMFIVEESGIGFVWNGEAWTNVGQIQGPIGPKGEKGDVGPTGEQGIVGAIGPQGEQGPEGPRGDKGDNGDDGIDGLPGIKGEKGDQGIKGDKGEKGEKGDKGDDGDDGIDGLPGIKGEKGDEGIKGDKGEKGAKGDKGDNGDDGIDGLPGIKGEKGDQGIKGDKGEKGEKGDKGDSGDDGIDGLPGVKGEKGDKGDKGNTGAKGDAGLACWDLNGDGKEDPVEDINQDGKWDALDCKGPKGDAGTGGGGPLAYGTVSASASMIYKGTRNWTAVLQGDAIQITVSNKSLTSGNCSVQVSSLGTAKPIGVDFKSGKIVINFDGGGRVPCSFLVHQ